MTQKDLFTKLCTMPITTLRGVGEVAQKKLNNLGIYHLLDLFLHFPLRYEDRTQITPITHLQPDTNALIVGQLISCQVQLSKRRQLLLQISDKHKILQIRFFQFNPQMKKIFEQKIGQTIACFGIVRQFSHLKEMVHPEIKWVKENYTPPPFLTAIYSSTEGLYQSLWQKITEQALQLLPVGLQIETDTFFSASPHTLLEAIRYIHRPPQDAQINELTAGTHPAQQRLIMEELLAHHLSFKASAQCLQETQAPILKSNETVLENFIQQFPFSLTSAQLRVSQEVSRDLAKSNAMLRLVQGDVGSGKTVVAAIATMQALLNGYQVALMAPTELLAQQHAQNFQQWFKADEFSIVLLSGKLTSKEQQKLHAGISEGQINMVIGTHALFQKNVEFSKLGLVIIDEQHRFGVAQRLALLEKGQGAGLTPHQLIMTATPIPRTLAMTFFADLAYSVIDELPKGRKPITTVAISHQRRMEVVERIRAYCQNGQQAYWVCTAISENENTILKAAEELVCELHQCLPQIQIALLHGKMKANEKTKIMHAFKAGEINLLVATTVIEVGVDVPNASLMIIDNAERLGLAQLHQLRGRVGRGSQASYCVLLYHPPLSEIAQQRLQTLRETNDGFLLAEKDLQLRGPGEVFGTRQTGLWQFKIADLMRDQHLLQHIPAIANAVLEQPHIMQALITRWLAVNLNLKSV